MLHATSQLGTTWAGHTSSPIHFITRTQVQGIFSVRELLSASAVSAVTAAVPSAAAATAATASARAVSFATAATAVAPTATAAVAAAVQDDDALLDPAFVCSDVSVYCLRLLSRAHVHQ